MTKKNTESAPVARTGAGLRDAIFDEIDAVRNGISNPTRANAIAKLASSIVETVRMEVEVQRHMRSMPKNEDPAPTALGRSIALGQGA